MRTWDVGTGEVVSDVEIAENLSFMNVSTALSRNGTRLALQAWGRAGTVPTLHVYDVAAREEVLTIEDVGIGGRPFGFSPDGALIAVGKPDGALEVWDIAAKQRVAPLGGHTASVTAVGFATDGSMLCSGSGDSTAIVLDLQQE